METTVREMHLNANENNDIPVKGTVGATQHDISPGGHDGDKCLNDKEKNDIHDEVFLGANKTDISEIGHCVPSVTGNQDIEAKECFNDRECNDSPVEGTVGGNQADIGRGGSSSVADQSMENDQPTKVLVVESQMLHGITIFEKGNMGLTLLKTDQGYLVVKSIDKNPPPN